MHVISAYLAWYACSAGFVSGRRSHSKAPVGVVLVFGHQSMVDLLMDLEFSWNGDQKFQLMGSLTTVLAVFQDTLVLRIVHPLAVGPICGCEDIDTG